jgi:5-methylcytosine-specific restriction endonuclease McrA
LTALCEELGCPYPVQARGKCNSHYSAWRRGQKAHSVTCESCGTATDVSEPGQRFCSRKCSGKFNGPSARIRSAELAAEARAERARSGRIELYKGPKLKRVVPQLVHIEGTGRWISASCIICDRPYLDRNVTGVTCSPECAGIRARDMKRLQHDRRRARKKNAFVANVYRKDIFEADDYICHLCDEPTDPEQVVPHPRAPTIDHVIPLANGGMHEPANCRTACFICNAQKSNRVPV